MPNQHEEKGSPIVAKHAKRSQHRLKTNRRPLVRTMSRWMAS